jgi:hypothetical protein
MLRARGHSRFSHHLCIEAPRDCLSGVFRIVRLGRFWNDHHGRSEKRLPGRRSGLLNRRTRSSPIVQNLERSRQLRAMPATRDGLGRTSQFRRASAERAPIRDRVNSSPATARQDRLAASLEHHSDSGDARWSARSSFLLILAVATAFWSSVYLLFFS